jgi:hypothetical protein
LTICGNTFPQSINFKLDLSDLKEWDKQAQEYPIMKKLIDDQGKTIQELEKSLAIEIRNNDLNQRELNLKDQIIGLKDQEIAATNRALAQMKDVTDRAIKLAEISKPKTNWELQGLLYAVAGVAGYFLGKK